jgi:biliverdin reductase
MLEATMLKVRWGVLGVGRAGKARVDALRADPRCDLVGAWRGDLSGLGLQAFHSYADMIQHVDAVAICSPDLFHADQVHTALTSRRHVVCEFPLASSAREASNLYALSIAYDRVLHVEHIELLTPAAGWLRQRAKGRNLLGGAVRFTCGPRPDVASPAHANIARLHRIIDAVGEPQGVRVERCNPEHLSLILDYPEGAELTVECRMEEGLERHMEMVLEFEDGNLRQEGAQVFEDGEEVELSEATGLFKADQLAATSAILDGASSYASMDQVLAALGLADTIVGQA